MSQDKTTPLRELRGGVVLVKRSRAICLTARYALRARYKTAFGVCDMPRVARRDYSAEGVSGARSRRFFSRMKALSACETASCDA